MDTDSFMLSVNTKDIIKDLKKLRDRNDFSNSYENLKIFGNKDKQKIGKFKIKSPADIWIDELICLRSKVYAFKCGNHSKNNIKKFF